MIAYRRQIADFALQNRLPMMGTTRGEAEAGALLSYGANVSELYRRAATYVDKILQGVQPADLPVEQPTTSPLELVINLKTAKALGLTIPPTLLFRADKVIQ